MDQEWKGKVLNFVALFCDFLKWLESKEGVEWLKSEDSEKWIEENPGAVSSWIKKHKQDYI